MAARIDSGRAFSSLWSDELPEKNGWYWYSECRNEGAQGKVWLAKIYAYRQRRWVRFMTGPYRVRVNRAGNSLIYKRTNLGRFARCHGKFRGYWHPAVAPPAPPHDKTDRDRDNVAFTLPLVIST